MDFFSVLTKMVSMVVLRSSITQDLSSTNVYYRYLYNLCFSFRAVASTRHYRHYVLCAYRMLYLSVSQENRSTSTCLFIKRSPLLIKFPDAFRKIRLRTLHAHVCPVFFSLRNLSGCKNSFQQILRNLHSWYNLRAISKPSFSCIKFRWVDHYISYWSLSCQTNRS